jgi:hypothetical protein
MKITKLFDDMLTRLLGLGLLALMWQPFTSGAALEQTFSALQVGTTTYRNVTITTKTKDYIFLIHSRGMANFKIRDLPSDLRTKLGYEDPAAPRVKNSAPAAWAKQTLSKMDVPQVHQIENRLVSWWRPGHLETKLPFPPLSPNALLIAAAALLALYFFHSYCCMLICIKAGSKPGALVWLPLLQLVPLLKAAAMSPWWLLGFLVPGLNLIAQILWCIRITRARGKAPIVALFLIFPLSSPFAALYLAFSGAGAAKRARPRFEIMTLEAA